MSEKAVREFLAQEFFEFQVEVSGLVLLLAREESAEEINSPPMILLQQAAACCPLRPHVAPVRRGLHRYVAKCAYCNAGHIAKVKGWFTSWHSSAAEESFHQLFLESDLETLDATLTARELLMKLQDLSR